MKKLKVAILGASGYTGAELINLLLAKDNVEIAALTADKNAGKQIGDIHARFKFAKLPTLIETYAVDYAGIDFAFGCLPHGVSQPVIAKIPAHVKVIDLSADFRLTDPKAYEEWYGHPHSAIDLQKEAVYGLVEINREKIKKARIIANPGCYPTSALLPLIPLLKNGLIEKDGIIIDSKSGVSGAGRTLKEQFLYCEANESIMAYGLPKHRHLPEIEQELSLAAGSKVEVTFSPHLTPMERGILSTIYVTLKKGETADSIKKNLQKTYAGESHVNVVADGSFPATAWVKNTSNCVMNVFEGRNANQAVIVSVIDNLLKGASGQAVQNMELLAGG